ncbi:hypothetical protein AX15_006993 [Amanita polypyramis BW_CC]|nr:hypothetical protein AX15_006993 [Amanita polypyramis BW_CC]
MILFFFFSFLPQSDRTITIPAMFFTPELLARRDNGFGLLWLAATLGSKSTFKKLPKRSVLTADIAQLCNLIVQPNEPLALRLSSNLMIGAARIYKVKQDIFFSDVSNCVTSLKKAVYELHALGEAELQLAQPTLRPAALTLPPDPKNAFMIEFDMLVPDWDEYLDLDGPSNKRALAEEDTDYDPKSRKTKTKGRPRPTTEIRNANAHTHTLVEDHDHVLSASFDISRINHADDQILSVGPPSTQEDFGFGDFFPMLDDHCLGDILGDELARELGWQSPVTGNRAGRIDVVHGVPVKAGIGNNVLPTSSFDLNNQPLNKMLSPAYAGVHEANFVSDALPLDSQTGPQGHDFESPHLRGMLSPAQYYEETRPKQPLDDITNKNTEDETGVCAAPQRTKRCRVLLDTRTELTDDELKLAREEYIKAQVVQRRESGAKRLEKECHKLLEVQICGAPLGVASPALIDFWKANLKAHISARATNVIVQEDRERPKKRRKTTGKLRGQSERGDTSPVPNFDNIGPIMDDVNRGGIEMVETGLYRSSEEPGQGRHASRPPSVIGSNLGFDIRLHESLSQTQKTFMFPWDNAGPSSSTGGAPFGLFSNNQVFPEQADVHLRESSRSRRRDSLAPSHIGSNFAAGDFSPAPVGRGSQGLAEDYEFDVKSSARNSVVPDARQTEMDMLALERNSLNFLEYAKMQFKTLPSSAQELSFDTIAPKSGSTRHVAAAAFYHCLGESLFPV